MRICGVELKGSDAIVVVVDVTPNQFDIVNTGVPKITLGKSESSEDVRAFNDTFHSFVRNHNIEKIGIKKRNTRGQFAGGAVSFKIEGLIQLSNDAEIFLIAAPTISAHVKKKKVPPFPDNLHNYQKVAYETVCTLCELLKDG